ncbi:MAG: rod shape-determining protein MreC, partial [Sinobacteraceae bacterium]|nr:rod shape-determining protein MreC [Nevskiaceae bacterium]
MAFGTGATSVRGAPPGFRFTIYAALAIVIMFMDKRGEYFERVHYVLSAAAYPIQLAVSSPSQAWQWMKESVATRDVLRAENDRLLARDRELELRTMRYEALARENDELRGLRDALPPVAAQWLVAEIVDIQLNSLRQRVILNRGALNGVFKGQAVLDDHGLLGQTTHVGPWSADVILITDSEHAVPVQIERTGLRTIAVGTGDTAELALPYLPGNADVKAGDVLLTSGLGGVFPAGYPVGKIVEVHRDAVQPLAQVRATPYAAVNTDREVMLVWFREGHPAAPLAANNPATGDAKTGNPHMQPQAAPHPGAAGSGTVAASGAAPAGAAPSPGDAAKLPPLLKPNTKPVVPTPAEPEEESPPYEVEAAAKPEPGAATIVSGAPAGTNGEAAAAAPSATHSKSSAKSKGSRN